MGLQVAEIHTCCGVQSGEPHLTARDYFPSEINAWSLFAKLVELALLVSAFFRPILPAHTCIQENKRIAHICAHACLTGCSPQADDRSSVVLIRTWSRGRVTALSSCHTIIIQPLSPTLSLSRIGSHWCGGRATSTTHNWQAISLDKHTEQLHWPHGCPLDAWRLCSVFVH